MAIAGRLEIITNRVNILSPKIREREITPGLALGDAREESRDRVFLNFYRVNKSRLRTTGGSGLGNSLVKHAVDLPGWKITASSSDTGTMFKVERPFAG